MPPAHFSFSAPLNFPRTLAYIGRYEIVQKKAVADGALLQVLADGSGFFLIRVSPTGKDSIHVEQLTGRSSHRRETLISKYISRTFGSDKDLLAFYRFARRDPVLASLIKRLRGVRVVGIVDLWECLAWSIIGQQVSVASAFSVRSRLARRASAIVKWKGIELEGFPRPQDVLTLGVSGLRECGLTRQKSGYVFEIAEAFHSEALSEEALLVLSRDEIRSVLLALRGIGPWSCEYAMMRVFADPDACPVEDIGLRNAIGKAYDLGRQATLKETMEISDRWKPYRGHATFYLWQTLL